MQLYNHCNILMEAFQLYQIYPHLIIRLLWKLTLRCLFVQFWRSTNAISLSLHNRYKYFRSISRKFEQLLASKSQTKIDTNFIFISLCLFTQKHRLIPRTLFKYLIQFRKRILSITADTKCRFHSTADAFINRRDDFKNDSSSKSHNTNLMSRAIIYCNSYLMDYFVDKKRIYIFRLAIGYELLVRVKGISIIRRVLLLSCVKITLFVQRTWMRFERWQFYTCDRRCHSNHDKYLQFMTHQNWLIS